MSNKLTGNEPASPIFFEGNLGQMNSTGGLTIRQQFAAMAMQGILASISETYDYKGYGALAADAVSYADELINELNKTK